MPEEKQYIEIGEPLVTMDGFEVRNPEQGKDYRWLNKNEVNVTRKQLMQGWEPVKGESPVDDGIRRADGTRVVGDTILAERPRGVSERHRQRLEERRKLLESEPKEQFLKAAEEANRQARDAGFDGKGVSTFEIGPGGSEDERQLSKPHRKNYRMGAGINRKTGDLER